MKRPVLFSIVLGLATGPAFGNLGGQDVKAFGGRYSLKCGAAGAPHLIVAADTVTMENGRKRLVARNLMSSYSYFGQSPPRNFEAALIGNLKPKASLTFLVYSDNAGRYITVEEDRKHSRYRHCKE